MADIDKVIKGLRCIKGDYIPCASCKYANADGYGRGDRCKKQCASDALALLKEQEAQIERLEHDLAVTQNNLNYYVNGND